VKGRAPSRNAEHRITRDAKEVTDAHTVLAAVPLVCIMDASQWSVR
jgi:hypothetical protein